MGAPIQSGASDAVEVRYGTMFDGKMRTLCGVATVPEPATIEWRNVRCRACLVLGSRTSKEAAARLARGRGYRRRARLTVSALIRQ